MRRRSPRSPSSTGRPVAFPVRLWRATRISIHLVAGLATTTFVFPRASAERRRSHILRWSRKLLRLMNVEARVHGAIDAHGGNVLIVANHVSWLDIVVLNAHRPARFVAKSELADWPVVGRLIRGSGTLFIERGRLRDTERINRRAAEVLASGDVIAVFPEGTTTDGSTMLRFHGSLLQPVVDAEGHVLPVAIRYHDGDGVLSLAPEYAGDTSFAASFWRVCGERRLAVDLIAAPALAARTRHRRDLAREAEDAIRAALARRDAATAPGTRGGPAT
ncbi:1-acyl-sn-glycerol-3-phosphate acyltransferase [Burkholderiales bacterium]|nr:1-acyl-sn-glycerol-3-phosphate acyltransferase [Burkholderiales bacterium]